MKLEIFRDYKERDVIKIDCDPQTLNIESEDFSFCDTIHFTCNYTSDCDVVRLNCEVQARVIMQCVRCLDDFESDLTGNFSLVVRKLRKGEIKPDYSDDESENDESKLIYIDHEINHIDVSDFVRDAIILSIPFNPICKESCKGLCSICGNNLNESDCGCKKGKNNTQWKDLSKLFNS